MVVYDASEGYGSECENGTCVAAVKPDALSSAEHMVNNVSSEVKPARPEYACHC